eukprot:299877-Rhodomonas_salina.4
MAKRSRNRLTNRITGKVGQRTSIKVSGSARLGSGTTYRCPFSPIPHSTVCYVSTGLRVARA